jgi:hypothetical protein
MCLTEVVAQMRQAGKSIATGWVPGIDAGIDDVF